MTDYQLQITNFEGPMEKLLELIEARELPITSVSLAEVTADFLEYMKKLERVHPKILADFIIVASRLILIKSHTLLPQLELSDEEKEEIGDLEERLKVYKELKAAEKNIKELWQRNVSLTRDFLMDFPPGFYFSGSLTLEDMLSAVQKLVGELEALFPKEEEKSIKIVSLEEKINELIERVDKVIGTSFNNIVSGLNKPDTIVTFLALLHLLKDSLLSFEQVDHLGEIILTKSTNE